MTTADINPLVAWPVRPMKVALHEIGKAQQAVDDLHGVFRRLVDPSIGPSISEEAPAASLELLGTITRFVARAELDLEFMAGQLQEIATMRDCIGLELNVQEADDAS